MDVYMCIEDHLDRHLAADLAEPNRWRDPADLDAARVEAERLIAESGLMPDGAYPTQVTFQRALCDPECDSFAVDQVAGQQYPYFTVDGYDIPDTLAESLLDVLESVLESGTVKWSWSHRASYYWSLDLNVARVAEQERKSHLQSVKNFSTLVDWLVERDHPVDSAAVEWNKKGMARLAAVYTDGIPAQGADLLRIVDHLNAVCSVVCTPEDIGAVKVEGEWRIGRTGSA